MIRKLVRWSIRTLVILGVLVAIALASDYYTSRVASNSVLVVTMRGTVVERGGPSLLGLVSARQTPLNLVRRALELAGDDPRIVGLAFKVIDPEMELAQAQELVAAIKAFRARGKWAAAYLETAGEFGPGHLPYLVASATGEIALMPLGDLNLVGVGIREIFARGTLDWLGIRPNFSATGDYKTAANIFTEKDFTPAQRREDESLVDSIFHQIVAATAAERKLDRETVVSLINQAPLSAQAGLKAKLVDRLEYEDEFTARIKERSGKKHALVDYSGYARPRFAPSFGFAERIAVIYGQGSIERGEGGFDPLFSSESGAMGSDTMVQAFRRAREDDSVRAVVFRVNSPGGSALASELIRRQVELTAKKKPVVVSMSGYAASGGYWISTPAQKIVAQPGTITGSIGVVGGKFNIAPAAGKIYLNTGAVTRGANVEMFDEFTDFTPEQAKLFHERFLGDTYSYFLKIVSVGRKLPVAEVDKIAQGRVWTGEQALGIKLIDQVGGFADALAEARRLAKIDRDAEITLIELPEQPSVLQALFSGRYAAAPRWAEVPALRALAPLWSMVRSTLGSDGIFGSVYCPVVPIL
jgi:protease-4